MTDRAELPDVIHEAIETELATMERLFREAMGDRYEGSDSQRRIQSVRAWHREKQEEKMRLQAEIAQHEQKLVDILEKATPQGTT